MTAHVRGCTGKRKFSSEAMAVEVATAKHRKFKKESVLHPYLCKHCGCWHASHMTQAEEDAEKATVLAIRERAGARERAKERGAIR